MNNKEFSKVLENRTRSSAIQLIKLSSLLPYTPEGKVIRNQITRSGTSIVANYRESNRSRSKADFMNKIRICESESSETVYWLEIIADMKWVDEKKINIVQKEANEILALYTSIGKKLKL
jgi:four helix bundle protein